MLEHMLVVEVVVVEEVVVVVVVVVVVQLHSMMENKWGHMKQHRVQHKAFSLALLVVLVEEEH